MATRDQLRVEAAVDLALAGRLDEATRLLVEAWGAAWDRVRPDLEASLTDLVAQYQGGKVTRTAILRDARLKAGLEALFEALDGVVRDSAVLTGTLVPAVTGTAADGARDMIRAGLTGTLRAELRAGVVAADPVQIREIITRATQQITARHYHLAEEAQAAIRRELMRGIVVGENPRRAASLAVRGIEDAWNGGLARAATIARTEMIDANRRAAQQVHAANADVLEGWEWVAHLGDDRTCRACLSKHGGVFDLDEPGPLGHPNCRCARVPRTKSWEALGFPGMREPVSRTPDADDWFQGLPEAEQRRILTDKGYERWRAGDWPRSEWATRRENPDWRPSFQAARP